MPISNSYPSGIPIEDPDLFVGTKAANNRTVNYTAQGIANYLNINSKVAIGGQMSFQFTVTPNIPKTISFDGGFGNNTAFSAITKLIVSAIDVSTANITIFLNYLNNSQVLLSEQNQPNFFGHYKITGYTQIGISAFYELDLEFIGGNGTIIDKQYYDLVSFVLSTEASPTEWGTIIGDIEDQTDLVNYVSSQITTPTLQEVTDAGNTTTNSIIVEDNAIVIEDNNNDTSFEINGYALIGKDLSTNKQRFELDFDGQMYAYNSAQVNHIQLLTFDTSGAQFQNYAFPSKPAGNYILATTSDTAPQVNSDWNSTSGVSEILNKPTIPAAQVNSDWNATSGVAEILNKPTITNGTVTSIGLTMPSAFTVTNSPITSSGDIAVTGAGLVSQYVRGDGTLANFPNSTGGGSSVNYYLNGSVSQGAFGGTTYYQMSKTPILGAGTNFTRTNGAGNGYIASFITDAGDPSFLNIPGGNWNLEFYFQSSASGGSPQFYGEIYKVSSTNVFTLVASGSANPEGITNGTTVDQYFTSIPVPQTSLLVTDRLAIRIYVITGGRTITLHTENGNLCEVLTTFTTGLAALNGLTQQVQNLAVGTSGTDFAISSATDTHTFDLPTASAINRGALSSADWTTFNNKQTDLGFTPENVANKQTDLTASATKYPTVDAVNTGLALKQNTLSYTPYKNIQTSQSAITATVAETVVFTATIPAGSFNSTDIIKVLFGANKTTGLGTFSLRLRINTTNTIVGAPTIGLFNGTATAQCDVMMRNFNLNGGNLRSLPFGTSAITDTTAVGGVLGSTPLNTANTFYIFGTVQLANLLDSIVGNMLSIHN